MILREATILYKGYDPEDLKDKSNLRICKSCDGCGRVGYTSKCCYTDLCRSCSIKKNHHNVSGKNNPMYGKKHSEISKNKMCNSSPNKSGKNNPFYGKCHSDESCKLISKNHADFKGENHPQWKGGFDYSRPYVLPEHRCIKLNSRFKGSEMHHLTKSIVIYIPYNLHHHIYHDLQKGLNMGSMNMLALQFINGEL